MKDNKRRWILTLAFISLLIIVRIICDSTDQILYIVYGINLIGMFYVIGQIMLEVYENISGGVSNGSLNTVLSRRNKKLRRKFVTRIVFLIIAAVAVAFIIYFLKLNDVLSIINDVIALITLGLSIEDEVLITWILYKLEA